jgi:hypothetical protein
MTFPTDHDPLYPYDIDEYVFWPGVVLLLILVVSIIAGIVVLFKRRR